MKAKKDILVIDDDPDIAEYCGTVLGSHGYQVRSAISAKEGEDALRAQRPDLVILDIMMESPESGLQLADVIARDFRGLPVILFSSIANASMQVFDTSKLPVSVIIEKPIEPQELLATVRKILKDESDDTPA
ncbi:MAG TPA: response regulator [Candidatus Hydrogenedentes bacterium]|nr:response regulator [Candidatus Hydrogenedentota bacterium]HNT86496.1 response regulator [Candidatus Hydrogenedentota bacterium]